MGQRTENAIHAVSDYGREERSVRYSGSFYRLARLGTEWSVRADGVIISGPKPYGHALADFLAVTGAI